MGRPCCEGLYLLFQLVLTMLIFLTRFIRLFLLFEHCNIGYTLTKDIHTLLVYSIPGCSVANPFDSELVVCLRLHLKIILDTAYFISHFLSPTKNVMNADTMA